AGRSPTTTRGCSRSTSGSPRRTLGARCAGTGGGVAADAQVHGGVQHRVVDDAPEHVEGRGIPAEAAEFSGDDLGVAGLLGSVEGVDLAAAMGHAAFEGE